MVRLHPTPLGALSLHVEKGALTRCWFDGEAEVEAAGAEDQRVMDAAKRQLDAYFAGVDTPFDLPLRPSGTPYQQRVWQALSRIRYGRTLSYQELAESLGSVARAVGQANGANPIGVIIPCHRVIKADGTLGGYAAGLERKQRLLELEGDRAPRLFGAPSYPA